MRLTFKNGLIHSFIAPFHVVGRKYQSTSSLSFFFLLEVYLDTGRISWDIVKTEYTSESFLSD